MKFFTTSLFGAAAVALMMGAGSAHAALITGTNLDFETPVPGGLTPNTDQHESANFSTAAVPGWIINNTSGFGDAGVWAPKAGGVFFSNPATWQGNQVGFLQTASNISQNMAGTYTGNAGTVTVTMLLGESLLSTINPAGDSITLLAGGIPLIGETLAAASTFNAPIAGQFVSETYTFNIGANPLMNGDIFGLEIANLTDPGEIFIDKFVIDGGTAVIPNGGGGNGGGGGGGGGGGSSVPEPASLSILGVALLGFAAWRRKGSSTMGFGAAA